MLGRKPIWSRGELNGSLSANRNRHDFGSPADNLRLADHVRWARYAVDSDVVQFHDPAIPAAEEAKYGTPMKNMVYRMTVAECTLVHLPGLIGDRSQS